MTEETAIYLPPGHDINGRYIIAEGDVLGHGGFGVVYLARDQLRDQTVVIKEYFPEILCYRQNSSTTLSAYTDASKRQDFQHGLNRFREEAQRLVGLEHPNIIPVTDYFEANGTAYMVMPYLDDLTLSNYLKENNTLTPDQVKLLLEPLIKGLEYIHERGLIHRDISPDNIIIDKNDNPVLIDFGAARYAAGSKTLSAIVKEGYSPPEQYVAETHENPQGAYTDIYALSATFYRCITGEALPPAPVRLMNDSFIPLSGRYPNFDETLLKMIDAGLTLKPSERPQNITDWKNFIHRPQAHKPRPSHDRTHSAFAPKNAVQQQAEMQQQAVVQPQHETSRKTPQKYKTTKNEYILFVAFFAIFIGIGVFLKYTGGDYSDWDDSIDYDSWENDVDSNNDSYLFDDAGENRVSFLEGEFSVNKPSSWSIMNDLNDSADLQIGNGFKEAYMIMLSEHKGDFDSMSIQEHSDITRGILRESITNYQETGPEYLDVSGHEAIRYKLTGSVNNVKITYWHVTIETNNHFHQMLLWSLASKFDSNTNDFEDVIYSFRVDQESAVENRRQPDIQKEVENYEVYEDKSQELTSFLDGKFSVYKPSSWTAMDDLNDSADLQLGNGFKEAYMIVLSEHKQDLDEMSIQEHSNITRDIFKGSITGYQEDGPEYLYVNGFDAVRYRLSGSISGYDIVYWHVTIETEEYFHQMLLWSLASKFAENENDFEEVIYSFREN